ncbi:hypothetical protein LSH36_325g04071 [Paralvinella palmiformis]|uniref:Uncharacterized protein n=1 Tax=Paralvinella palmiformis TaxID=53620 RepID=A0AAD9N362_9ANNE|nr:hypothetical protein LSH36_325g04071 [Paralvinella palmiformis]
MLVSGYQYNVSDMEGFMDGCGWRQQVEPVDLSCATSSTGMSRVSGYGEPLDLSTSRRAHPSGYDPRLYYSPHGHPQYYNAAAGHESRVRRWVAPPHTYCGYGAQAPYDGGATCNEAAPSWTNWNPYEVGMSDTAKAYPRGRVHNNEQDKICPQYPLGGGFPERAACAFSEKRDACRYPDTLSCGSGYPPHIGTEYERSVYHTNGGSCKYAQSRAYVSGHSPRSQSPVVPETSAQYANCHLDTRKQPEMTTPGRRSEVSKGLEGIPVLVSNCKHFAGGLVVSRRDNGSPLTEPLPPISIPDFEFREPTDDKERVGEDELENGTRYPEDGRTEVDMAAEREERK